MTYAAVLGSQLGDWVSPTPPDAVRQSEIITNFANAIAAAETGLEVVAGVVEFDHEAATTSGLANGDVYYAQRFVDRLNELVAGGFLSLGAGSTGWQSITSNSDAYWTGTVCNTTINSRSYQITAEAKWYGTVITLDKAATELLVKLLNTGAAAAAVAAAIATLVGAVPPAVVAALASAIFWLGAAIVDLCDFCNGVKIIIPRIGSPFVVPA